MDAVWKKLQLKEQRRICVVDAPEEFEAALDSLDDAVTVDRSIPARGVEFALVFVQTDEDVARRAAQTVRALEPDALLWFAYPKKNSKRYQAKIDRDHGWQPLGDLDYEPVRQIAIDEDWSALRFRHVDQIGSMTRRDSMKLSDAARRRTGET